MSVIEVNGLVKTYKIGFFRKKVEAVRGIDFKVGDGEVFGLLGPNGAGKTSTIKILLGLTYPSAGRVSVFGDETRSRETMKRIGYMPENPYIYQYLKPEEFLDLCARLIGMPRATRGDAVMAMIDKVGLNHAIGRPIGKFSKGMMQRIGIAQALLHDPDVLVLDEPMSGLDPIGRKEVRDLILEQRRAGKTILFTSHILSDVEALCDRVGIMRQGKMHHYGNLEDLLRQGSNQVDVEVDGADKELISKFKKIARDVRDIEGRVHVDVDSSEKAQEIVKLTIENGGQVVAITPGRVSLESVFVDDEKAEEEE